MWFHLTLVLYSFTLAGRDIEKEKNNDSPPISVRLRELSNNLKALCNATPSLPTMVGKNDASNHALVPTDIMEPKTPVVEHSMMMGNKSNYKIFNSPWEALNVHSTGMKVQLKTFLHDAIPRICL